MGAAAREPRRWHCRAGRPAGDARAAAYAATAREHLDWVATKSPGGALRPAPGPRLLVPGARHCKNPARLVHCLWALAVPTTY